jgi:glycosyltransferase A (GT-A) superfamily protein (DUF2064 family)
MTSNVSLACFVKTPGMSPVKTRLAAEVGRELSEHLYGLCIKIHEEILLNLNQLDVAVFWAIHESEASDHPLWSRAKNVSQGLGSLGEKIINVYSGLAKDYEKTILIGSDTPQLTITIIREAIIALDYFDEVVGPSLDGGFYLYASKSSKAEDGWLDVSYSTTDTRKQFCKNNDPSKVYYLRPLSDLDYKKDLMIIKKDLEIIPDLLPSQSALLKLISSL